MLSKLAPDLPYRMVKGLFFGNINYEWLIVIMLIHLLVIKNRKWLQNIYIVICN